MYHLASIFFLALAARAAPVPGQALFVRDGVPVAATVTPASPREECHGGPQAPVWIDYEVNTEDFGVFFQQCTYVRLLDDPPPDWDARARCEEPQIFYQCQKEFPPRVLIGWWAARNGTRTAFSAPGTETCVSASGAPLPCPRAEDVARMWNSAVPWPPSFVASGASHPAVAVAVFAIEFGAPYQGRLILYLSGCTSGQGAVRCGAGARARVLIEAL